MNRLFFLCSFCLSLLVSASAVAQSDDGQCPRRSGPTTIDIDQIVVVHHGHGHTEQEPLARHMNDDEIATSLALLRSFLEEQRLSCSHAVRVSLVLSGDHTYRAYILVRRPEDECWERASSIIVLANSSGANLATPVGMTPREVIAAVRSSGYVMSLGRQLACPGHPLF